MGNLLKLRPSFQLCKLAERTWTTQHYVFGQTAMRELEGCKQQWLWWQSICRFVAALLLLLARCLLHCRLCRGMSFVNGICCRFGLFTISWWLAWPAYLNVSVARVNTQRKNVSVFNSSRLKEVIKSHHAILPLTPWSGFKCNYWNGRAVNYVANVEAIRLNVEGDRHC